MKKDSNICDTKCRSAFEEWYEDGWSSYNVKLERSGDGYAQTLAEDQWEAWQAAWKARGEIDD